MFKILFIQKQLVCGGIEQALFDLLNLLDKDTFDITLLVQQEGGIWEQKFRDAGIKLTHVYDCQKASRNPAIKGINLVKRMLLNRAWKKNGKGALNVALPGDYDIIVNYGVVIFDEICFYRNAKTVKYIHGDPGTNKPYCEYIERYADTFRKFNKIICVSKAALCSFVDKTGITENCVTRYNPLNSDNIKRLALEAVNLAFDLPIVCAVGRLSPEKGFDRLVRIHKNLLDKGIAHRLVIVGEGFEREKIEEVIRRTGTQDSVILAGYQSNPYPYMKQSAFLVSSSYTEGLPVISMEALCLGVPIVSAVPSIGEVFGDECCGIVTENDDASLEAGIEKMLTDPAFYEKACQGAQRRSAYFNGKKMEKEVGNIFLSLLNEE